MAAKIESEGMSNQERTDHCLKETPHQLTIACIRSRIARGWTNERIIKTSSDTVSRPGMNHPFKRKTYNRVARKKGWAETPE